MRATPIMVPGLGSHNARIPISIREMLESQSPMSPIVFIPIFCPSLLADSCRTMPGTPIIARRT